MAGADLADALREARLHAEAGYATTVGYWNGPGDAPDAVAAEAFALAEASKPGSEVSIKLVGIGGDRPVLDALAPTRRAKLRAQPAGSTRPLPVRSAVRSPAVGCEASTMRRCSARPGCGKDRGG